MSTVYVNVGGTWKTASNYYVNVGGTWKTGSAIGPNVSDAWKGFDPTITTTNLKLHLDANDSSSYGGTGTTWTDLTTEDNDGTISGATFDNSILGSVFDLDGTDDYISVPDDASIEPSNADWTFEAWINVDSSASGYNTIFAKNAPIQLYWNNNKLELYGNDTDSTSDYDLGIDSGTNSLAKDGWHHIVVSRASNVWKIYIDKVQKASTTANFTVADTSVSAYIGNYGGDQYFFNGKIAQVRIYKGTGLTATQVADNYDATKAITDLKIYLDGDFTDSYNGSGTTWYDLSPGITAKSVDFDGTDDYLTTTEAYIDKSDSFCVEAWVNWDSTGTESDMGMICSQYEYADGRMLFGSQSGNCVVRINGGDIELETGSNTISTGTWYHVAWTWDGTTHRLFLDGVLKDSSTSNFNIYTGTETEIGGQSTLGSGSYWIDGKISNFRIVQGNAVYTSAFSPSTQPLTSITGTALLCCQSNSSAATATVSSGTITAAGSPTVSIDHPFGNSGAITGATWDNTNKWFELDGTDDRFNITSGSHAPGTGDFAVTCWVRFSEDTNGFVWDTRSSTSEDDGLILFYYGGSDNSWRVWTNNSSQIASSANAVSLDTWYHTVVTRISGTTTLYINGTSIGSFSDSFNYTHDDIVIGNNVTNATYWEGDISSFRAYKNAGLTSADVTAQYNAQKSKFGY